MADPHVALVDPLRADRTLDLGDPVVEVDEHHAVGDDALTADRHMLVHAPHAVLADDRLCADPQLALVHADLAARPQPRPPAEDDLRARADLERHAGADEAQPVGLQPPAELHLQPRPARDEPRIVEVEHVVPAQEAQQRERGGGGR
ncbi:MAG: hypothetical protein ACEQSX_09205, partial [Baekduiaceae bacterium]